MAGWPGPENRGWRAGLARAVWRGVGEVTRAHTNTHTHTEMEKENTSKGVTTENIYIYIFHYIDVVAGQRE